MYKRSLVALALLASANGLFADHAPVAAARTFLGFTIPTFSLPKVTLPKLSLPKLSLPTMETVKTTAKSTAEAVGLFCKKQAVKGFNLVKENRPTSAKIAASVLVAGVVIGAAVKARNKWLDTYVEYNDYAGYNLFNGALYYAKRHMTRREHKQVYGTYFNVKPKPLF